jgi:hypothetical protein
MVVLSERLFLSRWAATLVNVRTSLLDPNVNGTRRPREQGRPRNVGKSIKDHTFLHILVCFSQYQAGIRPVRLNHIR